MNYIRGGIPARYGGRLASVLDITSRDGNRREFAGNAGVSPVTTHFILEGPLKKDTIFYLIAGRTTYSNWILGMLDNKALRNSSALFYDLNSRLVYDISRNDKIDISTYYSYDSFQFNADTTYKYQNNILALQWRHFFTSRLFSSLTLNNSYYGYDISSQRVKQEAFNLSHRVNSTGIKADFNWYTGRNEFNFGTELTRYDIRPGDYMPVGDSSLVVPNSVQRQRALEYSLYFEDKYSLTDYISVNAGVRLTSFFALGPQKVFLYIPGYTRSAFSIKDTLNYGKNRIYRTYGEPELRLSANIRIDTKSSLKLNYNHTKQYLHMLSNTTSISPNDIWKLSDYHLKPQTADQIAAGYYRLLNKNKIEASAEIYYKKIKNMADFKGGTEIIMNEFIEWDLINVEGKAYGLELMLKKPKGRVRWNIGYTYSRVLIRSTSSIGEEIINSGEWFPANFDRPHDLVITFNYLFSRRISFSANYNYSTGRPVTYPIASYAIGDIVLVHYSDRNKYRLPDYSRLDLSLKVSGNLRAKKIANPHWIFSVYNFLGRPNVYSVFFRNDKNIVKGYKLSVFGRPIPSVSFNFDF
ncbi:MAG: TonB-dependent receptor plug domain-containing protein [Bacteroidales bacterium]